MQAYARGVQIPSRVLRDSEVACKNGSDMKKAGRSTQSDPER